MAFSFNGTSSYIEATSTPVTGAPLTMACWFQTNTSNQTSTFMCIGNSASNHKIELGTNNNLLKMGIRAAGSAINTFHNTNMSTNVWYHATAVFVSPTSRFVILNGAGKIESTTSRIPIGLNNITLGAGNTSASKDLFSNCYIAEVGIWNEALTDDEVLSLSKGFAPSLIRPSNLKFYNRCIQKSQDLYGGIVLTELDDQLDEPGITKIDHPRIYG